MASQPPLAPPVTTARDAWLAWLPAISAAALLLGAALTFGQDIAQLKDNTRRIEVLEAKSDGRDDKLNAIDLRTARIESKLEVLLPAQRRESQP